MGVRAGDTPGVLTAWYDRAWNPCAERDARYRLDILIHGPEGAGPCRQAGRPVGGGNHRRQDGGRRFRRALPPERAAVSTRRL